MRLRFNLCIISLCGAAMAAQAEESQDTTLSNSLQELVVTGQNAWQRLSSDIGSESLELSRLAVTPQLFGEPDIIKSMHFCPASAMRPTVQEVSR